MQPAIIDVASERDHVTAWRWRPSKRDWFRRLVPRVRALRIPRQLGLDEGVVRDALTTAALAEAEWLFHPAMGVLLRDEDQRPDAHGIVQLVAWLAANVADASSSLGSVEVPDGQRLWTASGIIVLQTGSVNVSALGQRMREDVSPLPIDLDLYDVLAGSNAHAPHGEQDRTEPIMSYIAALTLLSSLDPALRDWLLSVTRVVAPPCGPVVAGQFRSGSDPSEPGLVRLDLGCEPLFTLEALVHEAAHHYFYLSETSGPIVAPAEAGRRFPSPLKREPRPLRGLMLAHHALAYIDQLYQLLGGLDVITDRTAFEQEHARIRSAAFAAEATCQSARPYLTAAGRHFFDRTAQVLHG